LLHKENAEYKKMHRTGAAKVHYKNMEMATAGETIKRDKKG